MGTIHKIISHKENRKQADNDHPASVLAIDIGGSKVKILAAGSNGTAKDTFREEFNACGHG